MSIYYCLKGANVTLCKRAFILSNIKSVVPVISDLRRQAHNGLYQMVKKKSSQERKVLPVNEKSNRLLSKSQIPNIKYPKPQSCNVKENNPNPYSRPNHGNNEPCRPKTSLNAEVLRAAKCNLNSISRKADDGKSSGGSGGGEEKQGSSNKLLLGIAAAMGLGGLVFYLLSGENKDSSVKKQDSKSESNKMFATASADIPKHVPYVLIGGGTASFSAFRAIKSNDAKAKVLMITDEFRKPYMRPPLSKELWYSAKNTPPTEDYRFKQWTGAERSLYFEPEEFFIDPSKLMNNENGGIAVAVGCKVKKINPVKRTITLTDDYEIGYDQCLIATGCSPKNLTVFEDAPSSVKERVMVYRTPEDFEKLKHYLDAKKSVTIIGNGFLGSELACSLANYTKDTGSRVYQVFSEDANMSKVLPDYLSKWTTKKMKAQGVCVVPNANIKDVKRDQDTLKLSLSTGETLVTDVIVVCVGCEANTGFAKLSQLEVDSNLGGFVVNAELEARRNVFVAGDASCFYDPLLGRRRVEHHDHSVVSGRLAGENMVGKKKPYNHQSMFWSDLGPEIGYEGIGLVDSSLPTVGIYALSSPETKRTNDNLSQTEKPVVVDNSKDSTSSNSQEVKCPEDGSEEYGRGVIFYLKDDKIVGILLWNIFNRIGLARTIINQNKKYDDLNEVAKLFEIHS